jgi:NRPS condensation-like uncharacterized protein
VIAVSIISCFGLPLLFPLRLSDFEYYMFRDDRPAYPMIIVVTVRVSGQLLREPFAQSLQELVADHPLLRSRIAASAESDWCWVPIETPGEILEWQPIAAADTFVLPNRRIDIRTEAGIHVLVAAGEERSQVVLYLHHACCDGLAALQLVGELFARYGQQTADPAGRRPEFERPDPSVLLLRDNYEVGDAAAIRQKRSLRRVIGKVCRLLLRKPVRIEIEAGLGAMQGRAQPTSEEPAAIQSRTLSKSTYRALRAWSTRQGVSVNDVFLREMILHVREWNRQAGVPLRKRWVRVAVPLSMRTSRHERMPAANVVSYALVTRNEADCSHSDTMLKSIRQQTSDVLFNREGIVCLKLFQVLRRIPGAMSLFLNLKPVLSSIVLANVGDVRRRFSGRFPLQNGRWVAGNVVIENIHGVAPVRPNTRAAMSIGDYAGELSISLRTDRLALTAEASERFLQGYLHRLMQLAAEETSASQDQSEDGNAEETPAQMQ